MEHSNVTVASSRLMAAGAAILGTSVFADSGLEHYRGSFRNPGMVLPIATSAIAVPLNMRRSMGSAARPGLGRAVDLVASIVGMAGFGFHLRNIGREPGGFRLINLFYKAPLGAPGAMVLTGLLGRASRRLQLGRPSPFTAKAFGAITVAGLVGTVAEAGLLHFRGAFHNPAMWLPLAVPPLASLSFARDLALGQPTGATRMLLGATAGLGLVGSAFHAYGIARNMGGWRNWRQNILAGPPLPAPPSFTGLAIAALGVMLLLPKRRRHD
ncbi:hypothetical protein [Novosphingobium malaysiense]|uniref:Uncharacterized protein n=1 Tax=Novosphingobium malaysiense TaxID=1348853 RepID=A0A0B1ZJM9_9SPHN|nr:hypothetical protein [Novosphingobium malaysiense]KHK90728.1 hypothetical protein LK12_15565 [Novosphingobium malaysiense]